jgi:hypothetical protein
MLPAVENPWVFHVEEEEEEEEDLHKPFDVVGTQESTESSGHIPPW